MPLIARCLTQVGALGWRLRRRVCVCVCGSFQSFLSSKPFLNPLLTRSRRTSALVQQLQHWSSVMLHLIWSMYISVCRLIWVTTTLKCSCCSSLLPLVLMFQKNLFKCKMLQSFFPYRKFRLNRRSCLWIGVAVRAQLLLLLLFWKRVDPCDSPVRRMLMKPSIFLTGEKATLSDVKYLEPRPKIRSLDHPSAPRSVGRLVG